MYNFEPISLCIIDDIKIVVDGLTAMNWSEHEIVVGGTATNGEDGLALVKKFKPDIIITDIRMPKMDGLTMLKALLETHRLSKVILISSYTDFDYAKQAVQLGAFDFVVKPFTKEDITEAVLRAKAQIIEEKSELLNIRDMELKLRESMPVLRQEYFTQLLNHRTPWEQTAQRWEFLKIELEPRGFVVMLLEIDGFQERAADLLVQEVELIRFTLHNITEETMREYTNCIVFRSAHNRFVAIMNDPVTMNAIQIAEQCCTNIERYTRFTVSIGVGGRVEQISELPDCYREADRALSYKLFTEGNGAIGYADIPKTDRQEPIALTQKEELLLILRSGNSGRAAKMLADISAEFQKLMTLPNPDYLQSLFEELSFSVIRTLYELLPYPTIQPLIERFKSIRSTSGLTLSALEQQLLVLCREGADLVRKNTLSEGQAVIYKAMDFLLAQLERDVTVAECAAHVHLSASYFSSLFKKVTGTTVTQYVTNERIQKAKALLIGGMPVQDVAFAVGYEERRYFSEVFKKTTGMTPSDFRASYESGNLIS